MMYVSSRFAVFATLLMTTSVCCQESIDFDSDNDLQKPTQISCTTEEKSPREPVCVCDEYFMQKDSRIRPLLEVKGGYFSFVNSKLREVYPWGGFDVQLSVSYPVGKSYENWGVLFYGSIEYAECWGKSLHGREKTNIWQVPVSIGIKPTFSISSHVQYYLTIGPRYFYLYQTNDSSYVSKRLHRSGVGAFINTGCNFIFFSHLLIDLFAEFSYEPLNFKHARPGTYGRSLQVGGYVAGTSVGYAF